MKFSIRDLLLVTVIVALAVGWWVDRVTRNKLEVLTAEETATAEKDRQHVLVLEKQLVMARRGLESQQKNIEFLKGKLRNSKPALNPSKE